MTGELYQRRRGWERIGTVINVTAYGVVTCRDWNLDSFTWMIKEFRQSSVLRSYKLVLIAGEVHRFRARLIAMTTENDKLILTFKELRSRRGYVDGVT